MSLTNTSVKILKGDVKKVLTDLAKNNEHVSRYTAIITSPPYYGRRNYGDDENEIGGEHSDQKYLDKLTEVFKLCKQFLTRDGSLWIVIGDSKKAGIRLNIPHRLAFSLEREGYQLRDDIVWFKRNHMSGSAKSSLTSAYEYILFFSMNQKCKVDNILKSSRKKGYSNFWDIPTLAHHGQPHYAMYPETLVERIISIATYPVDAVLDPFAGRGTTGIVCAENGRRFLGIDLYEYRSSNPKRTLFETFGSLV